MAGRASIFAQALALRPRSATAATVAVARASIVRTQPLFSRTYASQPPKDVPVAEKGATGPNMQQQEHVSEEAAKMAKITGGEGPDLEQGTPVQELLRDDPEAQKHAPQVLKDSLKHNVPPPKPSQSRTFSTYARMRNVELGGQNPPASLDPTLFTTQPSSSSSSSPSSLESSSATSSTSTTTTTAAATTTAETLPAAAGEATGHKFGLPTLPLPSNAHKDYRYDPVVDQFTNLLMRDGKLSVAQKNMALILQYLRTNPAPTYNPTRPLLPGAPPASHLPLNPTLYLTLALDSLAPLLRIRSQRGAAGGGVALQIPVPLGLRQRRRTAATWLLDAASKRKTRGSGPGGFALKVAEEIVAVVEGRSSCWEKRMGVHKIATTARSNLNARRR